MDNRHLCRGKRLDNLNKDWVVGHYVSVPRHMIVLAETMPNGSWNCFDIDPSTLGHCTGLSAQKSYRGTEPEDLLIWEGDTIRCFYANSQKSEWTEVVVFHEGAFRAEHKSDTGATWWTLLPGTAKHLPQDTSVYITHCEIIGTIHDGGGK